MAISPELALRLDSRRRALLGVLGDSHAGLRVVHVGGTNGKGSTVAMVASILRAAGHKVGRFTSPDLNGPHERFWLDGRAIAPQALDALLAEITPLAERVAADFPDLPLWRPFELWCQAAWCYFSRAGVDLAVVEVGMGGRTDATNVFSLPIATLVTEIGLDHALCLGHDLSTLAREKAGIFRSGVPAMSTATGLALETLAAEAVRVGAPFRAVSPLVGRQASGGWLIETDAGSSHLALAGHHQLANAALALAAVDAVRAQGFAVPPEAVRDGLATVSWPGRMERVLDDEAGEWLLDAAHNPAAVEALVASWQPPDVVVLGVQRSKEAAAMVAALSAGGRTLVLVPVPEAESWTADELEAFALGPTHRAADVEEALALAKAIAPVGPRAVTGSIYLVGAARARLLRSR